MEPSKRKEIELLSKYFQRNGYYRFKNEQRLLVEGAQIYKKGNEVRLVANSEDELIEIREILDALDFRYGSISKKNNQFRIPIYGIEQVERFMEMMNNILK